MKKLPDQIIHYPKIGDITYKRNLRARRLTIAIRNTRGVRVTIPGVLSFKTAESFVLSKSGWIVEKLNQLKETQLKTLGFEEFRTRDHILRFFPTTSDKIRVRVVKPEIIIFYPEQLGFENGMVQQAAIRGIETAYRNEANEYLPERVHYLAEKFGYRFNAIRIKKTSSRWGSCSAMNNINLSIFLMKLPNELIDFIILHELCHTRHKNHGKKFWSELEVVTNGRAKELSKMIKGYTARV